MRSTLINKKEIKYPCLMAATNSEAGKVVVLFKDYRSGVVVHSERELQPLGYHSEAWVMSGFSPFDGTIELSNN